MNTTKYEHNVGMYNIRDLYYCVFRRIKLSSRSQISFSSSNSKERRRNMILKNGLVHDPVISEQLFNWELNTVKLSLEISQLCLPSLKGKVHPCTGTEVR